MCAARASLSSPLRPTHPIAVLAAELLDRLIIGVSTLFSFEVSARCRTFDLRRYATSSIAFRTLAEGCVCFARYPHAPFAVLTWKEMLPACRVLAYWRALR